MKTYIICTSLPQFTISKYFFSLALFLKQRGDRVIIVIDQNYDGTRNYNGITLYSWPSKRPVNIRDFWFFYKLCRRYKPDVTLGQFGSTNVVLIVSWLMRVNVRLTYIHTASEAIRIDNNKNRYILKYLQLRKKYVLQFFATNILTNSKATLEDIAATMKIDKKKIFVFYPLLEDVIAKNKLKGVDEREKAIAFVGRIDASKGQEKVIDFIPRILDIDSQFKFRFIGGGTQKERLLKKVMRMGIDSNVEFTGAVPLSKVYHYLSISLLHISCSVDEAFGLVNAEALTAGTPIMAARVGGIKEILIDGENGFFFEPDDEDDFVKKLIELTGDKWPLYSLRARQSFENNFMMGNETVKKQIEKMDMIVNNDL
ncbi:glycosyltransferase family 4 protein [Marinilabiliaceae bacterium ANBcel2]|nr:glycosyltransferase family 4 protein [Marinilabiliaceae bacterium ANBcel2]